MVRRYDIEENEDGVLEIVDRQNGDFVLAEDYDALVEERDELKVIIADAIQRLRDA